MAADSETFPWDEEPELAVAMAHRLLAEGDLNSDDMWAIAYCQVPAFKS